MSNVSLNPVRYYDITDIYTAAVDNRPLRDISSNVDLLNSAIQALGFYQELYASPDVEPPGGFTPFTCVAVSASNRLIPIDISLSSLTVDYTRYPIYLILESLGSSLYKCLAFSSSISLPSSFSGFLGEAVGRSLKIGPGGNLVDEVYFDLFYGSLPYQHINVGKILTKSSFSFGGNQVNTLGDNRFLSKNANDSTTGLITRLIDLEDTHTAVSSMIIPDTIKLAGSKYPFTSYVNGVGGAYSTSANLPSPVYFSYRELPVDSNTGTLNGDVSSILNEVHFSNVVIAPTVTNTSSYSFTTAGVNVNSLLSFASAYLLRGSDYSTYLKESSQTINTSLHLVSGSQDVPVPSSIILATTPFSYKPSSLDPAFLLDPVILSYIQGTEVPGVSFGNFLPSSSAFNQGGGFIGVTVDAGTDSGTSPVFDDKGPSEFSNTNSLIVYSKQSTDNRVAGSAALYLLSDGYLVLGAKNGAFYKNTPTLGYEITNKNYVDTSLTTISDQVKSKIPLVGTTSENPVTGFLYFDTTSSTASNVNFVFKNVSASEFRSATPYEFKTGDGTALGIVRGRTVSDSSTSPVPTDDDFTTRLYVNTQIEALIGEDIRNLVTKDTDQSITGHKSFDGSTGGISVGPTAELLLSSYKSSSTDVVLSVPIGTTTFGVAHTNSEALVKLKSANTEEADVAETVVTKGYLGSVVNSAIGTQFNDDAVYAIWGFHAVAPTKAAVPDTFRHNGSESDYANFFFRCVTNGTPMEYSNNYYTLFSPNSDGSLTYVGTKKGLFMVTMEDFRPSGRGQALINDIYRSQTSILVTRGGSVLQFGYAMIQVDAAPKGENHLTGSTCSSMITLEPNDILSCVTEWGDHACASLALIRYVTS